MTYTNPIKEARAIPRWACEMSQTMDQQQADTTWTKFCEYAKLVSLTRVKMKDVPDDLKEIVMAYREELTKQLADPENESWDSLSLDEMHNAMLAIKQRYAPAPARIAGNCPRCSGTGFIGAYSHIRAGKCLACNGTGNIKTK